MTRKETIRYVVIQSIGNFLVLFAIFGILATFGPALYYEAQYRIIQVRGVRFAVEQPTEPIARPAETSEEFPIAKSTVSFGDVLSGPTEQILTPIDTLFSVLIPKIGANARVFPNVDPSSEEAFVPILKKGVAHSEGTFFPGQKGNIYLFAHSTDNFWDVGRYNAIFYLLKDLGKGDEVVVFFQNVRHNYVITGTKIINSTEVSYITEAKTGKETLILQTCWPPGTTWQRLLVFAEPK